MVDPQNPTPPNLGTTPSANDMAMSPVLQVQAALEKSAKPIAAAVATAVAEKAKASKIRGDKQKSEKAKLVAKIEVKDAKPSFWSKLPFFGKDKSGSHQRVYNRHPCCLISELLFPEKAVKLEGVVIEISRGGILFREASIYIMNRVGATVDVLAGNMLLPGKIVNVSNKGYGIKLNTLMTDDQVNALLSMGAPQLASMAAAASENAKLAKTA